MSTPEQQLAVLHACALLRISDLEATLREIRGMVERQHWGILGHYFDGVAAGAVPPLYYAAETDCDGNAGSKPASVLTEQRDAAGSGTGVLTVTPSVISPETESDRTLETPADYTIDGDGVWMGGKWQPSGGPKAETPANAWLCVCGLTVKKRYTCLCGGREDNSTSDRLDEHG
jgi:hypothetical protein